MPPSNADTQPNIKVVDTISSKPPALVANWYYATGGKRLGPVDRETITSLISSGQIERDTFVWREGIPGWTMAKLTELEPLFKSQPPPLYNLTSIINGDCDFPNNSGTGMDATVPKAIAGNFNFSAFCMPVFWCIAHNLWQISLLYVALGAVLGGTVGMGWVYWSSLTIAALVLGIFADGLAWKNRAFDSIKEFKAVQKAWAKGGPFS